MMEIKRYKILLQFLEIEQVSRLMTNSLVWDAKVIHVMY